MTATIAWTTIKVELTDMEPILGTAETSALSGYGGHDNQMIRPTTAEVHITDGGVVKSVIIRGEHLTKTGAVSKRHTYDGMAIGHYKLEAEIGATALAQLREQL